MNSPVELFSRCSTSELFIQSDFIWLYKINNQWIPLPDAIMAAIENHFQHGVEEITIKKILHVDLKNFFIENLVKGSEKKPIRRQRRYPTLLISPIDMMNNESYRLERFSFPLGITSSCSVSLDTNYYGSPFIASWYLTFTEGKHDVTFDKIFPVLLQGLCEEGKLEPKRVIEDIITNLNQIKNNSLKKKEKKRMEELENYCIKLYTKSCFVYRMVNTALRDDDRTKLHTLGPYCFLVYNYIGRPNNVKPSIRPRFKKSPHQDGSEFMTVFRGDYISPEMIKECERAVGDHSKYFKWLPFISTSREQDIAEHFAQKSLYIIKLLRYASDDQFADLSSISVFKEAEVLLRPGVRFQVTKVEFDCIKCLQLVHVTIIPSYVSVLR